VAAGVALPDATAVQAGAFVAHAISSVDRLAAGTSMPAQTLVPLPPPRLSVRGARAPTSQGGTAPITLFLLFLSRRQVL
jgi:hypothetical protein